MTNIITHQIDIKSWIQFYVKIVYHSILCALLIFDSLKEGQEVVKRRKQIICSKTVRNKRSITVSSFISTWHVVCKFYKEKSATMHLPKLRRLLKEKIWILVMASTNYYISFHRTSTLACISSIALDIDTHSFA